MLFDFGPFLAFYSSRNSRGLPTSISFMKYKIGSSKAEIGSVEQSNYTRLVLYELLC